MQKSSFRFLVFLSVLLFAATAMAQNQLVIEGTGDSQLLLRELAKAFEAGNSGTQIIIPDTIGSSGGVKALAKGRCDMARVARPLKEHEKELASDFGYREFALSPVVFAGRQPEACVAGLSSEQVIGIFSGAISNWSELGNCKPHPIYVAMREFGDSARSVLEKMIPGFKEIKAFAGQELYSTPETIETIAANPGTIGYLPQVYNNPNIDYFLFNGISPNETHIKDGSYPLVTPYGLVWRGELSDLAARFLNFINSPEGEEIIRAVGVVPVSAN